MPVFVAVVVLGLVFFLSCLLAIHLDEKRRRLRPATDTRLIPLETVPAGARMQSHRKVIPLSAKLATQSSRTSTKGFGRSNTPIKNSERAAGSASFRKLSRGGER
jgi:hypothetical protein